MSETVYIEHCVNCRTHSWCTNHDEDKYKDYYSRCQSAILSCCNHVTVAENVIPEQLSDKFIADVQTSRPGKLHFPRIGAFEVYFRGKVVFSKLDSMKWPNLTKIAEKIRDIQEQRSVKERPKKKHSTGKYKTGFKSKSKKNRFKPLGKTHRPDSHKRSQSKSVESRARSKNKNFGNVLHGSDYKLHELNKKTSGEDIKVPQKIQRPKEMALKKEEKVQVVEKLSNRESVENQIEDFHEKKNPQKPNEKNQSPHSFRSSSSSDKIKKWLNENSGKEAGLKPSKKTPEVQVPKLESENQSNLNPGLAESKNSEALQNKPELKQPEPVSSSSSSHQNKESSHSGSAEEYDSDPEFKKSSSSEYKEDYEQDYPEEQKEHSKKSESSSDKDYDQDFEEQNHPIREVTKSFTVKIPVGEECRKKISYENLSDWDSEFVINSSHPDELSVKDNVIHIKKGAKEKIQLRFAPVFTESEKKFYLYIDKDASEWECIEIVAIFEE